ncbi:hypothetical protein V8F06_000019 [Rhypophila decipiens]
MRLVAEINRAASGKLGSRCFGPRFTNVLQSVQQFAALGDVMMGSENIIACGVWSVVRMTMLRIVQFPSSFKKISILLMDVGRSAPRYQRMVLLYPQSKRLQSHLFEYFTVVVHLCHELLRFTKKSTSVRPVSFPSDSMKDYQLKLERWAYSIKEEVNLLMENVKEQSSSLKVLTKLKKMIRILDSCSTYDYQTTWKEIRKAGNATLFRQNPEYQDWRARTNSCTLVYTGKPGSGKSVLLANIVDDLSLYVQNAGVPVAYFFCRHDIPESLSAQTIIGSLARQLLLNIVDLNSLEYFIDTTALVLDFETILRVLRHALPPDFKAYFILDGLDECDSPQRLELTKQLRTLQGAFALRICVSSRLEADGGLESFTKCSTITIPDDNPDIRDFIRAELERCIESGNLTVGDPAVILEIKDALLQGAQGMFLWAALQIDSLCAAKTDEAIRKALADLPKDLRKILSRILRRLKKYQVRMLELVAVAYRPLTTDELREALSVRVKTGDAFWKPALHPYNIHSAIASCRGLITLNEEDLTVTFAHYGVKQLLVPGFRKRTVWYSQWKARRGQWEILSSPISITIL